MSVKQPELSGMVIKQIYKKLPGELEAAFTPAEDMLGQQCPTNDLCEEKCIC